MVAKKIINCFEKDFDDYKIKFSVSIATGEVFFATIGHSSLKVHDIFGETVNKSAILNKEISKINESYLLCDETKKYLK